MHSLFYIYPNTTANYWRNELTDLTLVERYNYDIFTPEKFEPWMNFPSSPRLGLEAPDFPLWQLDGSETRLFDLFSSHRFTILEFGSFT
jgi:hypothetical protein